ncbi:MAG TPA: ATP-binding protein [Clostridiaceae bacterium]
MIPRQVYMSRLLAYKDNVIIKIITGLRRCGKSTLLQLFREHLLNNDVLETNIIYINFELMEYDDISNYKDLYKIIKSKIHNTNKTYILLDEIQQVKGWEKAINGLVVELDVDIYITGSNAYLLSSELSTLLSGRYVEIKMLPLSFKEYLTFQHFDNKLSLEEKFNQYLKYGSLPAISALPQQNDIINDFLMGIYNTVILKDVVQRNNIKDPTMLDRVIKYVISNIGNIISANKISTYLTNQAKEDKGIQNSTISNYLTMLENAFILYRVNRYDIKGKELLKSLSKYYVVDTGIRNALLGYTDTDYGHILENIVYFELLRRGYQVFIGKWYDLEVDFIAVKQDEKKYFQVSYTVTDENVKSRELASLNAINDNYEKILLTMDKTFITDHQGIKFVNVLDFLIE